MTAVRSYNQNFFETQLTAEMGPNDLTAFVNSIGTLVSPCYLVIEPDDNAQREVIFFDDTFGASSFVASNISMRYLAGSAAGSNLTHPIGSIVRSVPAAQHIEDLHDRIDLITHGSLAGLSNDDHPQYTLADGSRSFTAEVAGVDPTVPAHLATKQYVDAQVAGGIPTGSIFPYAGASAPGGYLLANGAEVSRATYSDLFSVIGTTFGVGDGSTTFDLPDLTDRFPLGVGTNARGDSGGELDPTVDLSHGHTVDAHVHTIDHGHADTLSVASGGAHTHSIPSHSHTIPSHTHSVAITHNHASQFTGTDSSGTTVGADSTPGVYSKNELGAATRPHIHDHAVDILNHSQSVTSGAWSGSTGSTAITTGSDGTHTHTLNGSVTAHSGNSGSATPGTSTELSAATALPNAPFLALNYIIKT